MPIVPKINYTVPDRVVSVSFSRLVKTKHLEAIIVIAVGKVAPAEQLEGSAYEREIAPRVRLELDDIVLHGKP